MLQWLRLAGLRRGLLGGSRIFIVIGAVAWGLRVIQLVTRRESLALATELKPGEALLITHEPGPVKGGKRRRKR